MEGGLSILKIGGGGGRTEYTENRWWWREDGVH